MATSTQSENNWGWWVVGAIVVIAILCWIAWASGSGNYYGGTGTAPAAGIAAPATTPGNGTGGTTP